MVFLSISFVSLINAGGDYHPPVCGDGIISLHHEQCDDGNTISGDGCSSQCMVEEPQCEGKCIFPDSLGDNEKELFNQSFGDEDNSLQKVLDDNGFSINATEDQEQYQIWLTDNQKDTVTLEIEFVKGIAQNKNVFGYYTDSDLNNFVALFKAKNHSSYPGAPLLNEGDKITVDIPISDVSKLGFAIDSQTPDGSSLKFATENSLNSDSKDHVVVFDSCNEYVVAFEDLLVSQSDMDYQDVVVVVRVLSCSVDVFCGDEIIQISNGEECDEGNDNGNQCTPSYESSCQYCSSSCESKTKHGPFCGDGVKQSPQEQCDGNDGVGQNQECTQDCKLTNLPFCGDGYVDSGEQCDDGNTNNDDGCTNQCKTNLEKIPVNTCKGEGELLVYQGNDPFQPINTSFEVDGDNLLIFTKGDDVTLNAKVNNVPKALTLAKEVATPFRVRIYSLNTSVGDIVTIEGSAPVQGDARAVQGYLSQNLSNMVYDINSLQVIIDNERTNNMFLTPDSYSYVFFDKYTFNAKTDVSPDLRKLNVVVKNNTNVIENQTFTQPSPVGVQGVVVGDYTIGSSGNYELSVDTEDSIYWMLVSCPQLPVCGDGHVDAGEQCDDGNTYNNDGCTNQCELPQCGDGYVQAGEQCDDGNTYNNDGCTNQCELPQCGDGYVQAGEQCDDGNTANGDGCTNQCNTALCGDGIVRVGVEQCDDGNTINNDSCTNQCNTALCGDGIVRVGVEQCDDGNTVNNDSCTNQCELPQCGDGYVQSGEQCDDGNTNNNDLCRNDCTIRQPQCGDGNLDNGEQCDDGNTNNTDACTNSCQNAFCGDGKVRTGVEQCDDGNTYNNDGCTNQCELPQCGDGYVQGQEQCDDGNTYNNDGCTNQCLTEFCGDGIVQTGEVCDDGNTADGDGCSAICEEEKECTKNSDCSDGLFCNGGEICNQNYECVAGTPPVVNDGLFCTTDSCDESQDKVLHNPLVVNDSVACTTDVCDENLNKIVHQPNDNLCNNGLFCDGTEYCNPLIGCQPGTAVSCTANNLPEILMCTNNPDSNPVTLDFAPGFTSVCNERTDSCTIGTYEFTHTCNANMCGAECELGEELAIECGTDVGECRSGEIVVQCTSSCEWESDRGKACVGEIKPVNEICDGKDNNCNGLTDEGLGNEFEKLKYSAVNTGDVILLDGFSAFSEERVDFFHGWIYQEDGRVDGEGSLHARGTSSNGTKVQINLKFTVIEIIESDCEKVTWRNSARGTYWVYGEGTEAIEEDYVDVTYYLLTGKIKVVGVGDVDFEFEDIIDNNFEG